MPDVGLIEKDIEAIINAGGTDKDVENYLSSSGVSYKINKEETKIKKPEKKVGFFGSIPESAYQQGERNIVGNIFERPASAIRSALQGTGYQYGAVNPGKIPSFQQIAVDKFTPKTPNVSTNFAGSVVPSTLGMIADTLTSPADLIPMVAGMSPTVQKAGKAIVNTPIAKAFSEFINKERSVTDITKHLPKKMNDSWLVGKAKNVKQVVDNTIDGLRGQYKKIFSAHNDSVIPADKLKTIPTVIKDAIGIEEGKTITVGELWDVRDNLLQQISEGAWGKEDLYKRLRVKEEDLMGAAQKIKATILDVLPKQSREAILSIDPKYTETMKLGKKILRTVYEPTTDTYKTGSLINVFQNPNNAGARDAFRRFEKYNNLIGQAEKDMHKYIFRQKAKKIAGSAVGTGALLYAGHRLLGNKLLGQE